MYFIMFVVFVSGLRLPSLRKHPFLRALRRWDVSARNVPSGEERGETDVFAGSVGFQELFHKSIWIYKGGLTPVFELSAV